MISSSELRLTTDELPGLLPSDYEGLARSLKSDLSSIFCCHTPEDAARALASSGLYRFLLPETLGGTSIDGRLGDRLDIVALLLIREALAQGSPLADSIFAVQGLGSHPLALAGSQQLQQRFFPDIVSGRALFAFGLTEPEAGSDVANLQTAAREEGDHYVLDGTKTFISNATIATHFTIFAKVEPAASSRSMAVFVVPATAAGLRVEAIPMTSPHPLGTVTLTGVRTSDLVGEVGQGFSLAMRTLDAFRISVAAAANGMAQRALILATARANERVQFGKKLAEQQIIKSYIAEMASDLIAGRLLAAEAARAHARQLPNASLLTAVSKMLCTERGFHVVDKAVQIFGGLGVVLGSEVEALSRDIRPLRIYEGTTEIQKLIIAKFILEGSHKRPH